MKKLFSLLSVMLVFGLFVQLSLPALKAVKKGTVKPEKKVPKRDRMDLAWEHEFNMTFDPATGDVPRERLLDAWKYKESQVKKSMGKSAINGLNWVERGPANRGGRTRALCVDVNDNTGKTVWVGGAGGGLWKTNDITVTSPTWVPINDFFSNLAITYIEQSAGDPSVMYFSTGEGNGNSDAIRGLGVWKSTDGGANWTQLSSTNNSNFYYCQKVFCPHGPDTVFVATRSGLFRSVNGGSSFSKVLGNGTSGATGDIAYDIERMSNGTLYASVSSSTASSGTIHKSYNNGSSWSSPLTVSGVSKREIELAVSETDTNTIWGLVENNSTIPAIIISTNAGSTFVTTSGYPDDVDTGIPNTDFSRGQAWYDLSIAVDPNNPAVCFVGGIDLFKTSNSGSNWQQVSHWYGQSFQEVHADQHYAVFAPGSSSICYFTNDGGVYRSTNATATVPTITGKYNNYNTAQFYACAVHPTSTNYFLMGAQDNGSHRLNASGLSNSVEVTGGDGMFCHIDQDQPQYQFTSYVYCNTFRSTNSGSTWATVISGNNNGRFVNPSDYDDVKNIMYMAYTTGSFLKWTNPQTGSSTATVSVTAFGSAQASAVTVSKNVPGRVYFGTSTGRIIRVDSAHTGTPISLQINTGSAISTSGYVSCIEVEKGNENHILLTLSNYGVVSIWETKNGGTTWASIEGNLPDMPVRWIVFHPKSSSRALIATELGVWSTDSIGGSSTNWAATNSGLANVRVDMLQVRDTDDVVAAATHGRGLFTCNLPALAPPQPNADFVTNKTVAYPTKAIQFTSISTGATSYYWDFGDGTTSTVQNPSKSYADGGSYNIVLTINSGASSITKVGYINILPFRGVPYQASHGGNFESNPGDFLPETFAGTGFQRGSSSVSGKSGTYSGSNAWVTGLTASTYLDNSYAVLYSPTFNLTASGTYTLSFYKKNIFEIGYDGIRVEYSYNGGNSWTPVGTSVGSNWYDFANATGTTSFPTGQAFFNSTRSAFTQLSYNVSSFAGNSNVAFRFVFKSDPASTAAGAAIDNFELAGPTNAAFPVTLTAFRGRYTDQREVVLNWATASESANRGFEIQRSTDGVGFTYAGWVKGYGNSSTAKNYGFSCAEPLPEGTVYYRLKQIDQDGHFIYSRIVSINIERDRSHFIKTFIPTRNSNEYFIESTRTADVQLNVVNSRGQTVLSRSVSDQMLLQMEGYSPGIYFMYFSDNSGNVQIEKALVR